MGALLPSLQGRDLAQADRSIAVLNCFGAKCLTKASSCPRAGRVTFNGLHLPQAIGITTELI